MSITIAIDGPAGSGKSTIARRLAEQLGITYLDTGAMYRAVTLRLIENGVGIQETQKLSEILKTMELDQIGQQTIMDGRDVSEQIRTQAVTARVSEVAGCLMVREALVEQQRAIARGKNIIMDGRDIGTVVLPDAGLKVFLTASPEERGRRRWAELQEKGVECSLDEIIQDIVRRDELDSNREHSPLKQAKDAVLIDTSHMTIDSVVEVVEALAKGKLRNAR